MDRFGRSLPMVGQDEYERILALLDQRRFDEAQVRGQVLLEQPETATIVRARAHNLLCWLFIEGLKRPAPEAVLHGEEGLRLAERLGEKELQVQTLFNLASARYQMGDYDGAEHSYHMAETILRQAPGLLPYGRALLLQGLARLDLVRGDSVQALDRLTDAEGLCADGEGQPLLADLLRRKAMLLLRLDRPQEAATTLLQVDEASLSAGPRSLWWRTHLGLSRASVEAALGRSARARVQAVNTIALARELGDMPVLAECTCLLATIEAAEGRKEASHRARLALNYAIQSGRRDVVDEVRRRVQEYLCSEL